MACSHHARRSNYWEARSSGEQGAATRALGSTDLRFVPLPPGFNARPYTMYQHIAAFGFPVYHGKELWTGEAAPEGRKAEVEREMRQRLLDNWRTALALAQETLANGEAIV